MILRRQDVLSILKGIRNSTLKGPSTIISRLIFLENRDLNLLTPT